MNIKNIDKISRNIKNATIKKEYQKISDTSSDSIFYRYSTSKGGLSGAEAKSRLKKEGKHIVEKSPQRWYRSLFLALLDPFFLIVIAIATVNMILGTFFASGMTYLFACMFILIRFFCLLYNNQTYKKILKKDALLVTVLRDGHETQIDKKELVTGDVVLLAKNCVVPADIYLFDKNSLELDTQIYGDDFGQNIALMGQEVKSGNSYGVVVKKSKHTYLSKLLLTSKPAPTVFTKNIFYLTQFFLAFGAAIVLAVFLISGIKLGDWLNVLLFVCTLALGISPDMLSFFVRFSVYRSIRQNYKKNVFIKNTYALQTLSQIDTVFFDMTDLNPEQKEKQIYAKFFVTSAMLHLFEKNTKKLTAAEFAKLEQKEAKKRISSAVLFVDFDTAQKQEVIKLSKGATQTICYFGNDAFLLRFADIGITSTDAADMCKISADIIVQDKSLEQVDKLLISGHKSRINTKKILSSVAATNILTLLPFLIATVFLPFTPLTAPMMLLAKIVTTLVCLTITSDNVDKNLKHEPKKWTAKSLLKNTIFLTIFSLVFYLIIFVLLRYALGYKTVTDAGNFQTGFFTFIIIFNVLVIFSTRHKTFLSHQNLPSLYFTLGCGIALVAAVALPFLFELFNYSSFAMFSALFFAYLVATILLATGTLFLTKYYISRKSASI